ncbi:MAG: hypothetical protein ACE3L7_25605 [Candidatus Pristimantibacillus sp.]
MITVAYKDLLIELEMLGYLQTDLMRQLHQNHRIVWTGMAPSDPMPVHVPLDKSLAQRNSMIERLTAVETEINIKLDLISKLEDKLKQLDGIQHTITFKRDVEGKDLKQIAQETGYSYSYVSKISAKSVKTLLLKT